MEYNLQSQVMSEHNVVGKKVPHVRSTEIVTGAARYCPDIRIPGMLVGKLLYSEYPSARITHIDTSKALALPGVVALLTHDDIPGENFFLHDEDLGADQPLLVDEFARYRGDAIAAVAALDETIAIAALEAIEIVYEPLAGIFDPWKAMDPEEARVWADKPNIADQYEYKLGDVEAGFEEADIIVENEYRTPLIEHAFLETESAVAYIDVDNTVVVYSSCQAPHQDRRQIARALGLPVNQVRVIVPFVGGAFGGKYEAHVQIHTALLAQATGRAVRIVRTREESIRTHLKRHPVIIRYRTGVSREGRITAVHYECILDTGPYMNAGPRVADVIAAFGSGPYDVPNVRAESKLVYTNNPIAGAMRGFGIPQVIFACELQMDEIARQLEMDPIRLRLINAMKTGSKFPVGGTVRQGAGMKFCLEQAADLAGWDTRKDVESQPSPHLRRGVGIGATVQPIDKGCAGAGIEMAPDGSVTIRTGAAEIGQGVHTVLAQLAAEAIGIEVSEIRVLTPDTGLAPDAGRTVASRQTYMSGNAIIRAAEPIRKSLLKIASDDTGLPEDLLSLRNGWVYAEGERLSIRVSDLAAKAKDRKLRLHGEGFYSETSDDNSNPVVKTDDVVCSFAVQIAKVLVDLRTGQVTVEELVAVNDIGRVVNLDGATGQVEGSCVMGIGFALMEELLLKEGVTVNPSLENYVIPTVADVGELKVAFVENAEPHAPYGAKGVGELPLGATAPAIANAVADAVGEPIRCLPITPERVLGAIQNQNKHKMDPSQGE
jgi:CO/xanthine dehydrogenase Mo-binding subunit